MDCAPTIFDGLWLMCLWSPSVHPDTDVSRYVTIRCEYNCELNALQADIFCELKSVSNILWFVAEMELTKV